ncbi:MAG: hypothetical protein LBH73_02130, partial [Spirochaetaceae bacterium]|nr:hypothetical protein [Spirochaetaceae bacterium]
MNAVIKNFQQLRDAVIFAPLGKTSVLAIGASFTTLSNAPSPAPPVEIKDKTIILIAEDSDQCITREASLSGPFFEVKAGGKLSLGQNGSSNRLILDGNAVSCSWPLVTVNHHAELVMNQSAVLRNNNSGSTLGGGVKVEGIFTMNGGDIQNNIAGGGGGVYIAPSGHVEISGGTIGGNAAREGGGVYITSGGSLRITGGTIGGSNKNTLTGSTGRGGGVYAFSFANIFMGRNAFISPNNDVFLKGGTHIFVEETLTGTIPVATLTPEFYPVSASIVKLVESDPALTLAVEARKFAVTPSGGKNYTVSDDGHLVVDGKVVKLASKNDSYTSLQAALNAAAVFDTVYLLTDITMSDPADTVSIPTGKTITLSPVDTHEKKILRGASSPFGSLITVSSGAALKLTGGLGSLVIDGDKQQADAALISVKNAWLEINNGVTIQNSNNIHSIGLGGAVNIDCAKDAPALTISGGTIRANTAAFGSAVYASGGILTISGGTIEENTSVNPANDGSIRTEDSSLILSGHAEIRNNEVRGVYARKGSLTMDGGLIKSNASAGVYIDDDSSFLMTGGEITGNKGDGVIVCQGTFDMRKNARVGVQNGGGGV